MSHVAVNEVEKASSATELERAALVGATTLRIRSKQSNRYAAGLYVIIDPYDAAKCEVKKVSAGSERDITLSSALTYAHDPGAVLHWRPDPILTPEYFGAKGDDATADESTAINRALEQATILGYDQGLAGRIKILLQAGKFYRITNPLNLCNMVGVEVDGGSPVMGAVIRGEVGAGKAIIEMIGTQNCYIHDIQIHGHSSNTPAVGVFASRSTVNSNGVHLYFDRVYFSGYFTETPFYSVENESVYLTQCQIAPQYVAGMKAGMVLSRSNVLSLTPVNATLLGGGNGITYYKFDRCAISGGTDARSIYLWDAAGDITISSTFLYANGTTQGIEIRGGATVFIRQSGLEGSPTNTIKLTYDAAAAGNVTRLDIDGWGWSTPSGYALLADTNALLRDSVFDHAWTSNKTVKVYQAESCDFRGLTYFDSTSHVVVQVDGSYSLRCFFRLHENHSLSYINGAYDVGSTIEDFTGGAGTEHIQLPQLQVGSNAASARITQILTASQAWNPGLISDGGAAYVDVTLTGVVSDGAWVCQAAYTGIVSGADVWILNAFANSNAVRVVLQNWCGGDRTPTGTVRVVAMKVA